MCLHDILQGVLCQIISSVGNKVQYDHFFPIVGSTSVFLCYAHSYQYQ